MVPKATKMDSYETGHENSVVFALNHENAYSNHVKK